MSGSEDEAFASAEEGEEEKAAKNAGKLGKSSAQSKKAGATAAGKPADTASGKQKGKQQQQRKKKSKGQPKSVKDEKELTSEKKPPEGAKSEPQTSSSSEAVSAEVSPESASASGKEAPVAVSPSREDPAGDSLGKDSSKPSGKDSSPKPETDQASETTVEKTKAAAKTAGEVRKDLKASTQADSASNPGDQVIPRDAGSGSTAGAGEGDAQAKGKEGGGDAEGGWSWGWGSSILTAATSSLETFTSQVGEGLTTIIDTVESSLGVPDPEEMVRAEAAVEPGTEPNGAETVTAQPREKVSVEEQKPVQADSSKEQKAEGAPGEKGDGKGEETDEAKAQEGGGWLTGWGVSNITSVGKSLVTKSQTLMNTGFEKAETLAAGGLDILETIGKKTYTTLTDHDPGLRRAREFLHLRDEKPSLSSVLKEDNQGLVHLEALEMLSNRSERKVQSLLSAMAESDLEAIRPHLVEIKDTFQQAMQGEDDKEQEGETEHDFNTLVTENLSELHLGTAPDKLNKVQETVRQWIADFYSHEDHSGISSAKEVQERAVQSLADVTSKAVEQFHKAGELVLMQKDDEKTYTHRAQSLAKLAHVLVTEVDILATKFSHCLNKIAEEKDSADEVNPMVTNVYLEASNASGYIQDAFQLLLPVIQHAALQAALSQAL
ncbi:hypothetical protein BaRGS_00026785 [Batillaria attramentaria]|uniref:Protein FAM114A2 n=1 Tax=Batillaria attramentaria TaxID=370345 RepID=A0ABD0K588_9CAEN